MTDFKTANAHRIAFADFLRTVAIFTVVICHVGSVLPNVSASYTAELENLGSWGVGCFFVLTGFLLARPYLEVLLDPERRNFPSTRLFLIRRFYRIWPLYACSVILAAAGGVINRSHGATFANVLAHLTFLHGFIPAFDGAPFGPLWTMAVDAQFYLLLPVIAAAMHSLLKGQNRAVRLRVIVSALAAITAISLSWRMLIAVLVPGVYHDLNTFTVYVRNVIGMAASFALGIGFALLEILHYRPSVRLCKIAVGAGISLIILYCVVSTRADRVTSLLFEDLIAGLSAVFLLSGLIEGRFPRMSRVAGSTITSTLAALSYAVYLFHKPVIVGVYQVMSRLGHSRSLLDSGVIVVTSLVVLAFLALIGHRFIELPFLRLRDKSRETPTVLPEAPFRTDETEIHAARV